MSDMFEHAVFSRRATGPTSTPARLCAKGNRTMTESDSHGIPRPTVPVLATRHRAWPPSGGDRHDSVSMQVGVLLVGPRRALRKAGPAPLPGMPDECATQVSGGIGRAADLVATGAESTPFAAIRQQATRFCHCQARHLPALCLAASQLPYSGGDPSRHGRGRRHPTPPGRSAPPAKPPGTRGVTAGRTTAAACTGTRCSTQ